MEASWDQALTLVAEKFRAAGAGLVGVAGDRLSNEDLFNFRKLVEGAGGGASLYSPMGGGEAVRQVGVGVGTNFSSMGKGAAILLVACDLEEEAPLWWLRVKQAAGRGATLIVANARPTRADRAANHTLRYRYGEEVATVQTLTGGASPAAQAFAGAENGVILFGSDGLDFAGSGALAAASANLLLATGHFGKPNNGLIGVWPHGNTQGAWELGVTPDGRSVAEITAGAKAAYLVAADPVGDGDAVRAEFTVVQELFLTETAKQADVVLPAQSFVEREGTYTSGERRVQRFYPALPPRGETKGDWQIAAEIGARLGPAPDTFGDGGQVLAAASPAAVLLEITREISAFAGVTVQALSKVEKQWPDVGGADSYYSGAAHENTQGVGVQLPSGAERGETPALARIAPPAAPSGEGLRLAPVTLLYDRGPTFAKSALMGPRLPEAHVQLSSADAARLGVGDGDRVRITLPGGEVTVPARVDGRAPEGSALLPRSLGLAVPAGAAVARISKAE
ncbi:MAG: molybdopterin-dependent oxidoreductase [Chloroflexi bacterium]|nr:molybdopterin-dependent oxidoreductase [Chloroflexota bacterium]